MQGLAGEPAPFKLTKRKGNMVDFNQLFRMAEKFNELQMLMFAATIEQLKDMQTFWAGVLKDFSVPPGPGCAFQNPFSYEQREQATPQEPLKTSGPAPAPLNASSTAAESATASAPSASKVAAAGKPAERPKSFDLASQTKARGVEAKKEAAKAVARTRNSRNIIRKTAEPAESATKRRVVRKTTRPQIKTPSSAKLQVRSPEEVTTVSKAKPQGSE